MADIEPDEDGGDDELEITDLRPGPVPSKDRVGHRRVPPLFPMDTRIGQRLAFVLVVGLVLAAVLSALPQVGAMLGIVKLPSSATAQLSPTTSGSTWVAVSSSNPVLISSTPEATSDVQTQPVPTLGPAPATCGDGKPPAMTHVGPPALNEAIGRAPVWVGGFSRTYPTLALGPGAQARAFDWDAPYTEYGWPAPIILVLQSGLRGPVLLSGWDAYGRSLQFGFVVAGVWGAPDHVSVTFLLDPAHPAIPAGGSDATGVFWYGYVFVPAAGCYTLNAAWPDGSWLVSVSAGLQR